MPFVSDDIDQKVHHRSRDEVILHVGTVHTLDDFSTIRRIAVILHVEDKQLCLRTVEAFTGIVDDTHSNLLGFQHLLAELNHFGMKHTMLLPVVKKPLGIVVRPDTVCLDRLLNHLLLGDTKFLGGVSEQVFLLCSVH